MSHIPTFSIITVCHNDLPRLKETAQSIGAQLCSDWEWVVVDAASRDDTKAWLETAPLPNMTWVSEPDRGIYDGFNKGTRLAKGKYLLYLCAGDFLAEPETLGQVRDFMMRNPGFDLYYGDSNEVFPDGSKFLREARDHKWIWYSEFTHHQSIFYARRCLELALYREEYRIGGDYAFNAEILFKGATGARMPLVVSDFSVGGISYRNYWEGERDNWDCRRDILGMSWISRAGIFAVHALVRGLRVTMPGIYGLLRYSRRPLDQRVDAESVRVTS